MGIYPTTIGSESINNEALKHWRKMEQIPFMNIFENTQSIPRWFLGSKVSGCRFR
jgi:hypothetical protein